MPLTQPIVSPSRDALRILRQLAFAGTLGGVALTEDRRQRLSTANRVRENERRLKASRYYHGAGTEAVKQLQEYGLAGLGGADLREGDQRVNLKWTTPVQDRPLLPGELDRLYRKERDFQNKETQGKAQATAPIEVSEKLHSKIRQVPVDDDFVMPNFLNSIKINHGPRIRHVKSFGTSSNPCREQILQNILRRHEQTQQRIRWTRIQRYQTMESEKQSGYKSQPSPAPSQLPVKSRIKIRKLAMKPDRSLYTVSALKVLESEDPERGSQQRCAVEIFDLLNQSKTDHNAALDAYACAKAYLDGPPSPVEAELSYQLLKLIEVLKGQSCVIESSKLEKGLAIRESATVISDLTRASKMDDAFRMFNRLYIDDRRPKLSTREIDVAMDLASSLAMSDHLSEAKLVIERLSSYGQNQVGIVKGIFTQMRSAKATAQLLKLYQAVENPCIAGDGTIFDWVISAHMSEGHRQEAEDMLVDGIRKGIQGTPDMFFRYFGWTWRLANDYNHLERLFEKLRAAYEGRQPSVKLFNAMIYMCGIASRNDMAHYYFNQMVKEEKVQPNFLTHSALAIGSASEGDLDSTKKRLMTSRKLKASTPHTSIEQAIFRDNIEWVFFYYGKTHYCPDLIEYMIRTLEEIRSKPPLWSTTLALQSCIYSENLPKLVEWLEYIHRQGTSLKGQANPIIKALQHVRHQRTDVVLDFIKSLQAIGGEGFVNKNGLKAIYDDVKTNMRQGSHDGEMNSDLSFEGRMDRRSPGFTIDARKNMQVASVAGRHEDVLRYFAEAVTREVKIDFAMIQMALESRTFCSSQDPNLPTALSIEEVAANAGITLQYMSNALKYTFKTDEDSVDNQTTIQAILDEGKAVYYGSSPSTAARKYYGHICGTVSYIYQIQRPRTGINLLIAHLSSEIEQKAPLPMSGLMYFLRGYIKTGSVAGILWVGREAIKRDMDITPVRVEYISREIKQLGRISKEDHQALEIMLRDLEGLRLRQYRRVGGWAKEVLGVLEWFFNLPPPITHLRRPMKVKASEEMDLSQADLNGVGRVLGDSSSSTYRSLHPAATAAGITTTTSSPAAATTSSIPPPASPGAPVTRTQQEQYTSEIAQLVAAAEDLRSANDSMKRLTSPRRQANKSRPFIKESSGKNRPPRPQSTPIQPSASKLARQMTKSLGLPVAPVPAAPSAAPAATPTSPTAATAAAAG
jgi:pentatricopeptide repeat protein